MATYCLVPTTRHWRRQNRADGTKISGCQEVGRDEAERRGFLGPETALCDIKGRVHITLHLSKPTEGTAPPRVRPGGNRGPWVIMVCQRRFIACHGRATLLGDADGRRHGSVWQRS